MKFDWIAFFVAMILITIGAVLLGIYAQSAHLTIGIMLVGEGLIFGIRAAIGKKE